MDIIEFSPWIEDAVDVSGGTVGRYIVDDKIGPKIAVQFNYIPNEKMESMFDTERSYIFMIPADGSIYMGWHLLRRGIVDRIKEIFKRRT